MTGFTALYSSAAVLLLTAAPLARSQEPQPSPAPAPPGAPRVVISDTVTPVELAETASAFGTVYDSLRFRPLAGAIVRVDSTDLVSVTDGFGRYQINGVPPGVHYLRVHHPLLDTLGVGLRTADIMFRAAEGSVHDLATPRAQLLIERFCSVAWRTRGPAAIFGRVREADTGEPAEGARVSLVYEETGSDGKPVPRVREARVGRDGIYRICGLPAKLDVRLQVIRDQLTSGDITVSFGEDLLVLRSMTIAAPGMVTVVAAKTADTLGTPDSARVGQPAVQAAEPIVLGSARLTGRVINRGGVPIGGARVILEGTPQVATTRADGSFTLDSLPPGTQSVSVRKLGFSPSEAAVDLASNQTRSVTVTMDEYVPTLEAVRVTAERDRALRDVGFTRRQRLGTGYYMDGDEINRESLNFSDVLRNVPGIRITYGQGGQIIESARGPFTCVAIWIDGTPWRQMEPGDIDDFVRPQELEAIEVYSPSNTPTEFQQRTGSCTTIIAWTSRRINRRNRTR